MRQNSTGLSLMEIMITLVIVAVVASLAYPRYQKMVSRSKQTEAKTLLRAIYVAEDLYQTMYQIYAGDLDSLDIEMPEDAKYQYSISVSEDKQTFTAIAIANIDNDPALDEWRIDHTNNLENTTNDAIE